MSTRGEHEIEPHPRGAWRAFVAGCVALALLLLGLVVGAHAETPPTIAGARSPMGEVLRHAAGFAAKQGLPVEAISPATRPASSS